MLSLLKKLISFPSITPNQAGSLDYIEALLKELGFTCHRLPFGQTDNLYARLGTEGFHLCFAGHIDVVPPGDGWTNDPFDPVIMDNKLYGRGAVDMKGGIACFLSAVQDLLAHSHPFKGSLSFLLTSDEEGPAHDGTIKVVQWLKERQEHIDFCLVGEPTCEQFVGDTFKVGRRGSLNTHLILKGRQGHVAYPHNAKNPIPLMLSFLNELIHHPMDKGTPHFPPSHLEVTSIDVGNATPNVIPYEISAKFNIRFNPFHTGTSLIKWIEEKALSHFQELPYQLNFQHSGDAFQSDSATFHHSIKNIIQGIIGHLPKASTGGGTSDARFIKDLCPVIELGLLNHHAHQVDENVPLCDLEVLKQIYMALLNHFFTPS